MCVDIIIAMLYRPRPGWCGAGCTGYCKERQSLGGPLHPPPPAKNPKAIPQQVMRVTAHSLLRDPPSTLLWRTAGGSQPGVASDWR